MNIKGKTMVITGASDGFGKELSLWSAKKGLKVALVSRSPEKLTSIKDQIEKENGIAEVFVCDVTSIDQVKKCVEKINNTFGQIDILVNNAGVWIEGELASNTEEDIHRAIAVNTLGTMYLTKNVLPLMQERKSGLIINVISQAGIYAKPERSVYNASKWAITGFTKCLQMEVSKYGVRVSGFYPGLLNTNLFEKVGVKKDKTNALELKKALTAFEFLLNCDEDVLVPEVGIKNIAN